MEFTIRPKGSTDIEQVREIVRAAFPTEVESKLVDALRVNGRAVISLVAVSGDEVLGHILFSAVSSPSPSPAKGIGLAPVAVRPDVQSQGIGSRLIHDGLSLCKELHFDYCVVLGDPNYYQRFGFEKASTFGMRNEYGVDHEFIVIRFTDRSAAGIVKYAPEFAVFSV